MRGLYTSAPCRLTLIALTSDESVAETLDALILRGVEDSNGVDDGFEICLVLTEDLGGVSGLVFEAQDVSGLS